MRNVISNNSFSFCISYSGPPLRSGGQSSWLQIQGPRTDFLISLVSTTEDPRLQSTKPTLRPRGPLR
jgi:hypothetical protein